MAQSGAERRSNSESGKFHPRTGLRMGFRTFRNGPQVFGVDLCVGENPSRPVHVSSENIRLSGNQTLGGEVMRMLYDYLDRGDLSTLPPEFLEAVQTFRRQRVEKVKHDKRAFVLDLSQDPSEDLILEGTNNFILVPNPKLRR